MHDCYLFKWPKTNKQFWQKKLNRNNAVDKKCQAGLIRTGWRVLTVWECALRGAKARSLPEVLDEVEVWIKTGCTSKELQ